MDKKEATKETEKLLDAAAMCRMNDKYEEAQNNVDRAMKISSDNHIPLLQARAIGMQAQLEKDVNDNQSALFHYQNALSIYQDIKDHGAIAHTVRHIADIETELGHMENAEKNYLSSLTYYRAESEPHDLHLANTLRGFAILKEKTGNVIEAKSLWEEARKIYNETGVQDGVDEIDQHMANL